MLDWLISKVFRRRHFWRTVSFDEISRLYVSRLLTVIAINAVNLFAAVFLWKMGYTLIEIAIYHAAIYFIRIPISFMAGKYTSYYGPKHSILVGNLLRIPSLIFFSLVPQMGVLAVVLFGFFQAFSVVFYNIGYNVDFSKIKHIQHAGKEIGYMQFIEKIGKILSPVAGGMIAALWSPEAVLIVASILFAISSVPLFKTVEPTRLRSRVNYKNMPWCLTWRALSSQFGSGVDYTASSLIWVMFISVYVFNGSGNGLYAILGGLTSLGVVVSMLASIFFGKTIDKNKGGLLVVGGNIGNIVTHCFRPFVANPINVVGINSASEVSTSASWMSILRLSFDVADSSGNRIGFMVLSQVFLDIGISLMALVWAVLMIIFGDQQGTVIAFYVAAIGMISIFPARFSR